ncbi:hypothetical protein TIFTF001_040748 [Ficus carica]|uniref:Uncharacterized protein n=2 Tax=Ficus carica TaxID=3494 RepID=A0AA87Z6N8_FICCA|nr:hypothetical protein TIFTF001_040727 [Ficus carica]GMN25557.1 hypothetical protein TIFTF001_040730 [Ficus carica]GMN25589.1 hypothetical protein TIFTF001_040737 [Ficus carica]GMN25616.1 hypothetical protein TIFTF001_040748 [Ficus carica]
MKGGPAACGHKVVGHDFLVSCISSDLSDDDVKRMKTELNTWRKSNLSPPKPSSGRLELKKICLDLEVAEEPIELIGEITIAWLKPE